MTRDVPVGRSRYSALVRIVPARNYRFGNRLYVIQIIRTLLYEGEIARFHGGIFFAILSLADKHRSIISRK